ncbi:hypothetical protein JVT61DRAFT_3279 [Boletus reticuloceps]|uniref:Uncharacterized protein n=1 Tax=Boletus reticuloceps TaxID=495285 RepID=A0A8I2YPE4_9AGAM|nr:hypothetical protein JVT61DRAFT_3279 [Boletus reticuloceps]
MILTHSYDSDTRLIKSTSSHSYAYHTQHIPVCQRSRMQQPTCTILRVRSPQDAQVIFHAVYVGVLPMVTRRLDTEERRAIASGSVFVWEERGPNPEATGLGIERWTDGKRQVVSQSHNPYLPEFLFYQEKDPEPVDVELNSDSDTTLGSGSRSRNNFRQEPVRSSLVKQTYSVYVDTSRGRRKWHLIAYFTADTADDLRTEAPVTTQPGTVCRETSQTIPRLINNSLHTLHQRACSIQAFRAQFHWVVMDPAVYRVWIEKDRRLHHWFTFKTFLRRGGIQWTRRYS